MNFCGEMITHRVFGRGEIVELSNNCLTVKFDEPQQTKKFIYPSALGTYLILENKVLGRQMQKERDVLAQTKAKEAAEKLLLEATEREKANSARKPARKTVKKPAAKRK